MHVNKTRTNKGMKYKKRDNPVINTRLAKCGHVSSEGRYFNCENCQPVLPEDDGDLVYFQSESEFEDDL